MGWLRRELESRVSDAATVWSDLCDRLTEVICALLHHLPINFPQTVTGIDDLESVREKLIVGEDILGAKVRKWALVVGYETEKLGY